MTRAVALSRWVVEKVFHTFAKGGPQMFITDGDRCNVYSGWEGDVVRLVALGFVEMGGKERLEARARRRMWPAEWRVEWYGGGLPREARRRRTVRDIGGGGGVGVRGGVGGMESGCSLWRVWWARLSWRWRDFGRAAVRALISASFCGTLVVVTGALFSER